jgi:UTP--glucose-1-phosphate uridylyltransferase
MRAVADLIRVIGIRQKEPKGLGHAVYMAHDLIDEDAFAVLLGDDLVSSSQPAIGQLIDAWNEHGKAVVAVERVPREHVNRYGVVGSGEKIGEGLTLVRDMVEKPDPAEAPSDLAIIGRYVLPRKIFDILRDQPPGRGGEIQLTDALLTLAQEEGVVACEFEGTRYDTGNKVGWIEANLAYALQRPELADAVRGLMKDMLERRG